ncbi:MAG: polysaccharide biosynthesis tyrosine autokinase [Oscillospiraceae bacterium]|nr:polysaccharide biosynthesis tyrosine autokinase [Oscillospiraceae bacterium]
MRGRIQAQNDVAEVSFCRLVNAVMRGIRAVVLASVVGAAAALLGTLLLLRPQFEASVTFYVDNSNISAGGGNVSMSSGDLTTSRGLVKSYIVILNTRETLAEVIGYAGAGRKVSELSDMIRAEPVNDTELFRVTVTSPDPQEAKKIADAVAHILPGRIGAIIEGTSAKVADKAVLPDEPSSPSYARYALVGCIFGFLLSAGILILRDLFDNGIRTEADIAQLCDYPVLALVPGMEAAGVAEACKLLRIKVRSALGEESGCHIIGMTASCIGEEKTHTAVELARSLAQLNKRVLLIDGDLRLPTVFTLLPVAQLQGLSDCLRGEADMGSVIQLCRASGRGQAFSVITSGRIPADPVELLSGPQMENLLDQARTAYDYVILDLPPVGETGDALAVAGLVDGYLLSVRLNGCSQSALRDTLTQLEFMNARILGIVCHRENSGGKGRKEKHSRDKKKKRNPKSGKKTEVPVL